MCGAYVIGRRGATSATTAVATVAGRGAAGGEGVGGLEGVELIDLFEFVGLELEFGFGLLAALGGGGGGGLLHELVDEALGFGLLGAEVGVDLGRGAVGEGGVVAVEGDFGGLGGDDGGFAAADGVVVEEDLLSWWSVRANGGGVDGVDLTSISRFKSSSLESPSCSMFSAWFVCCLLHVPL